MSIFLVLSARARGLVLLSLMVAMFAVSTAPVNATDFSGYVQATYGTQWRWVEGPSAHFHWRPIAGGRAWMAMEHEYLENIGDVPLTEANLLIVPTVLEYFDETGTLITVIDPVELAQLIRVVNSDEMWQDGYVTWLGTIQPGQSKRSVLQFWVGISGVLYWFMYDWSLWYLP